MKWILGTLALAGPRAGVQAQPAGLRDVCVAGRAVAEPLFHAGLDGENRGAGDFARRSFGNRRNVREVAVETEPGSAWRSVVDAGRFPAARGPDAMPHRLKVDGARWRWPAWRAAKPKVLNYQVTFLMRGYYQMGPLLVETGDVFGLHRRFRIRTEPHFALVLPKVLPLARLQSGFAPADGRNPPGPPAV